MAHHLELMERAKVAIDRLFADSSVSQQETDDSLGELAEIIGAMRETLDTGEE